MSGVKNWLLAKDDPEYRKARVVLAALFGPLVIWPVLAGASPILGVGVEETFKVLLVVEGCSLKKKNRARMALVIGGLFGVSETMLFLINAGFLGSLEFWWWRVGLTIPMHALTAYVIYRMGCWGKLGLVISWLAAILIHYGFNVVVGRI